MNSLEYQPFQFDPNEFNMTNSPGINGFRSARFETNSQRYQSDYEKFPSFSTPPYRDHQYSSVGIESLSPLSDSIMEKNDRSSMKPSSPIGEPSLLKYKSSPNNFQGSVSKPNHQNLNAYHFGGSPTNTSFPSLSSSPSQHQSSNPFSPITSIMNNGGHDSSLYAPPPAHMLGLFSPTWPHAIFPPVFSSPKEELLEEPSTLASAIDQVIPNHSNLDSDLDEFHRASGVEVEISVSPTGMDSINGQANGGNPDLLFSLHGEHPLGEHPSRTLFVRNINSNVEDDELRSLFESFGTIRSIYTQCKHRGFVMISYYDIRHAKTAMRHLQGKIIRRRKIDIHYSIPKFNPTEKDQNQGTLVVFNLDPNISNEELKSIFGYFGEIKEIRETPNKKHHKFVEFYDVRDADKAMKHLNKTEIKSKKIKIEPSRPGGARKVLMRQMNFELIDSECSSSPPTPTFSASLPTDGKINFDSVLSPFLFGKVKEDNLDEDISSSCPETSFSTSGEQLLANYRSRTANHSYSHSPDHKSGGATPTIHTPSANSPSTVEVVGAVPPVLPVPLRSLSSSPATSSSDPHPHPNPHPASITCLPALPATFDKSSPRNSSKAQNKTEVAHSSSSRSNRLPRADPTNCSTSATPSNGNGNGHNTKSDQVLSTTSQLGGGPADDKLLFLIDLVRVNEGEDIRTTLMIKNIPNKYSQKMLLAAVDENHKGLYDFFYLPIDFKNKCNVGYAFINFISPLSIPSFFCAFNHSKWEKFNSEKVCAITYARIQGKVSLISHFQNSSLMCEDRKCRPIIFHSEGPNQGEVEPFPIGPNVRPRRGGSKEDGAQKSTP
eukprot:TRINITY_DN4310_c0_g2_i1.p1 TRINITY_DN4310_c0_g2~~TRINITY_DN4310_c0_g2_i1.p1  ORF type:complete len:831 (+),score=148.37 TRINITY_DN4310_c0_g2_i1:133-2625(+)